MWKTSVLSKYFSSKLLVKYNDMQDKVTKSTIATHTVHSNGITKMLLTLDKGGSLKTNEAVVGVVNDINSRKPIRSALKNNGVPISNNLSFRFRIFYLINTGEKSIKIILTTDFSFVAYHMPYHTIEIPFWCWVTPTIGENEIGCWIYKVHQMCWQCIIHFCQCIDVSFSKIRVFVRNWKFFIFFLLY